VIPRIGIATPPVHRRRDQFGGDARSISEKGRTGGKRLRCMASACRTHDVAVERERLAGLAARFVRDVPLWIVADPPASVSGSR